MDQAALIELITKQVVEKISNKIEEPPLIFKNDLKEKILIIITQEEGIKTLIQDLEVLDNFHFIYFPILKIKIDFKNAVVLDKLPQELESFLEKFQYIFITHLTLNWMSKLANLIEDELISKIVLSSFFKPQNKKKKIITKDDLILAYQKGERILEIFEDTIITPLAYEEAKKYGIEVRKI
ncbi:MAG: hypothetical protein HYU63_01450 [Armatimonadetes bacterium]|nr:hypothetical protein [Armatimonadota bacterium]